MSQCYCLPLSLCSFCANNFPPGAGPKGRSTTLLQCLLQHSHLHKVSCDRHCVFRNLPWFAARDDAAGTPTKPAIRSTEIRPVARETQRTNRRSTRMRSPQVRVCAAAYRACWSGPTGHGPRAAVSGFQRRESHPSDTPAPCPTLRNESKGNLKQTDKAFDRATICSDAKSMKPQNCGGLLL